jgi:hypothetical protein
MQIKVKVTLEVTTDRLLSDDEKEEALKQFFDNLDGRFIYFASCKTPAKVVKVEVEDAESCQK